ncbi:MAG: hypothetical protein KAI64_01795, partial [Thermoplasmata archaeon]|nr:hypothetical protein [Thermoplasmata archaeon]
MRKFRDKLELTYKSVRIRNIQRILIAVQLILIISLSVLILAISGVSLRPFYFPLDFVLFFLIVMLLVFSLEAIFFRVLEIGYSTNYSAIHFMTKNSLRRATALLVFSVLILATPLLVTYAKGELSESGNAAVTIGDPTYLNLTNRDRLALTETTSINVTIQSGAEVRIWLMTSEDFENAVASGNFGSETATLVIPTTRTVNLPKSLLGKNYEEYVVRI